MLWSEGTGVWFQETTYLVFHSCNINSYNLDTGTTHYVLVKKKKNGEIYLSPPTHKYTLVFQLSLIVFFCIIKITVCLQEFLNGKNIGITCSLFIAKVQLLTVYAQRPACT